MFEVSRDRAAAASSKIRDDIHPGDVSNCFAPFLFFAVPTGDQRIGFCVAALSAVEWATAELIGFW